MGESPDHRFDWRSERPDLLGQDIDNPVVLLEPAVDDEDGFAARRPAIALAHIRPYDDVGQAEIDLKRQGQESFAVGGACGRRPAPPPAPPRHAAGV